jgi:bifunctional UDP-N-acetylglucosamine pyrophosphorylase/glucosamine-1-phosphate N-acetyltransferase
MKSELPKVLHPLAGRPMVMYSVEAGRELADEPPVLVVGHGGPGVREVVGEAARYAEQAEQLGTGHAVAQCRAMLEGNADHVIVCYADMPLLRADTLRDLLAAQREHSGPLSMLTLEADKPRGFGRIVWGDDGAVRAIVEEAVATEEQRRIREVNVGIYCFDGDWLWAHLDQIPLSAKGEYYLTDLVGLAVDEGASVQALTMDDPAEALGINTRVHLAEAETALRQRINEKWMLAGVTLIDPATTYIDAAATLGPDTVILPNTHIWGATTIGRNCKIGPNAILRDATVGDRCEIDSSVVEEATLEDDVDAGPFAHLRKGAYLESGVHMGNFGEIKNSRLRRGVKMGHFSYIGDADIGEEVNIGAGAITCNYDGVRKNKTTIGAGSFIGSDTMLVAPITLGRGARTGAGSVVTKDVPDDRLAVGMPARVRKLSPTQDSESKS